MALNLSRFFGGKSAREAGSGNATVVGDGPPPTGQLTADGKFGPATGAVERDGYANLETAYLRDGSGPAVSPQESENGGLDMTGEAPAAIALDTWEHAATGAAGAGQPDGIMVWNGEAVSHGVVMKDGANNVTLENYASAPGGAPEADGIMVWNGEAVSHGFKSTSGMDDEPENAARMANPDEPLGYNALVKNESLKEVRGINDQTPADWNEPEAAQDVFVTEVLSGADGISVFGVGGGVDEVAVTNARELALDDFRAPAPPEGNGIIWDYEQRVSGDFDGNGAVDVVDYISSADAGERAPGLKFETEVTDWRDKADAEGLVPARLEFPNVAGARADHPVADDVAFSVPEVDDEVLVSGVHREADEEGNLEFSSRTSPHVDGVNGAGSGPGYIGETEKNSVWDDTDIAHVTVPKLDGTSKEAGLIGEIGFPAADAVSIESVELTHEGIKGFPARGGSNETQDYNPKELWEAAHREGDPRVKWELSELDAAKNEVSIETLEAHSVVGGAFESRTLPHADGVRDDDGPSTLLEMDSVGSFQSGALHDSDQFGAFAAADNDDGDSLRDLEIDI